MSHSEYDEKATPKKTSVFYGKNDDDGNSHLHLAAKSNLASLKLLLNKKEYLLNKVNKEGRTPLHEAAKAYKTENVKYLMSRGAELLTCDNSGEICFKTITVRTPRALEVCQQDKMSNRYDNIQAINTCLLQTYLTLMVWGLG